MATTTSSSPSPSTSPAPRALTAAGAGVGASAVETAGGPPSPDSTRTFVVYATTISSPVLDVVMFASLIPTMDGVPGAVYHAITGGARPPRVPPRPHTTPL